MSEPFEPLYDETTTIVCTYYIEIYYISSYSKEFLTNSNSHHWRKSSGTTSLLPQVQYKFHLCENWALTNKIETVSTMMIVINLATFYLTDKLASDATSYFRQCFSTLRFHDYSSKLANECKLFVPLSFKSCYRAQCVIRF